LLFQLKLDFDSVVVLARCKLIFPFFRHGVDRRDVDRVIFGWTKQCGCPAIQAQRH
jgi:hypothetical protein